MGYRKQAGASGKIEIPGNVKDQIAISLFCKAVHKAGANNIPLLLIFNLDQTSLKFVPGSHLT